MSRFSTTAKLVDLAHQKIFDRQKSARLKTWILAVSTALAVLGTAPFAQAAIVKGTISGTWDSSANGIFNLGETFTADYSYDDTTISAPPHLNYSSPFSSSTYFSAALSSLRVTSGSYGHTFDFLTTRAGSGNFYFGEYAQNAPYYTPYSSRRVAVSAIDWSSGFTSFDAETISGQDNGIPFLTEYAGAGNGNSSFYTSLAITNSNVNFSPTSTAVTAVPTPALLPGLAAFGLGVWRKRKQAKQVEV